MILPAKHLRQDRALLGLGQELLANVNDGHTVSELWERVREGRAPHLPPLSFDWFVLALTFLFTIEAISVDHGVIHTRATE